MSDLDNARRLLAEAEERELKVYGAMSLDARIRLSAGWVAIANAAVDEKAWGNQDEV